MSISISLSDGSSRSFDSVSDAHAFARYGGRYGEERDLLAFLPRIGVLHVTSTWSVAIPALESTPALAMWLAACGASSTPALWAEAAELAERRGRTTSDMVDEQVIATAIAAGVALAAAVGAPSAPTIAPDGYLYLTSGSAVVSCVGGETRISGESALSVLQRAEAAARRAYYGLGSNPTWTPPADLVEAAEAEREEIRARVALAMA